MAISSPDSSAISARRRLRCKHQLGVKNSGSPKRRLRNSNRPSGKVAASVIL
jgi:hypothetical protein